MIRFRSNTPPIALPAPLQARAMIGPEARARGERRAPSSTPLPLEPDLAGKKPTRWQPWPRARWPRRTLTPAPDRAAAAGGRCPPEPAGRRRTQARTYERTAAGTYVPGSQRQLSRSAAYVMSTFTTGKSIQEGVLMPGLNARPHYPTHVTDWASGKDGGAPWQQSVSGTVLNERCGRARGPMEGARTTRAGRGINADHGVT
jgi:hypothetical protein